MLRHETGFFNPNETERYQRTAMMTSGNRNADTQQQGDKDQTQTRGSTIRPMARGTYGEVYLATDTADHGSLVTIKKLRSRHGAVTIATQPMVLRELAILRSLQPHPNIMEAYNIVPIIVSAEHAKVELVAEYMPTTVDAYYRARADKGELLPAPVVRDIMRGLLEALSHLERNNVIHRDVKPQNILLKETGSREVPGLATMPTVTVKLCDFGSARLALPSDYQEGDRPCSPRTTSPCWRAPEVHLGSQSYGFAVDVWAAGCVFAELLAGRILFLSADLECNTFDFLRRIFTVFGSPERAAEWNALMPFDPRFPLEPEFFGGVDVLLREFPKFKSNGPSSLANLWNGILPRRAGVLGFDLLNRLLTLNPAQRIRAEDALMHPYFAEPEVSLSTRADGPAE